MIIKYYFFQRLLELFAATSVWGLIYTTLFQI